MGREVREHLKEVTLENSIKDLEIEALKATIRLMEGRSVWKDEDRERTCL